MNPVDFLPLVAIMGIIYFLMIRPAQQERQAHETLIAGLSVDDWVVTQGGLWGRVTKVDATTLVLEVSDKSRVTFDKAAVARKVDAESAKPSRT